MQNKKELRPSGTVPFLTYRILEQAREKNGDSER
jgi:hypothetical protein